MDLFRVDIVKKEDVKTLVFSLILILIVASSTGFALYTWVETRSDNTIVVHAMTTDDQDASQ